MDSNFANMRALMQVLIHIFIPYVNMYIFYSFLHISFLILTCHSCHWRNSWFIFVVINFINSFEELVQKLWFRIIHSVAERFLIKKSVFTIHLYSSAPATKIQLYGSIFHPQTPPSPCFPKAHQQASKISNCVLSISSFRKSNCDWMVKLEPSMLLTNRTIYCSKLPSVLPNRTVAYNWLAYIIICGIS